MTAEAAILMGVAALAGAVVGVSARSIQVAWVSRAPGGQREPSWSSRLQAAVGLGAGLLAAGTVLHFGLTWLLPAHLLMVLAASVLSVIDLQFRRLPDVLVLPTAAILLVLLAVGSAGVPAWGALIRAVCAGLALFAFFLLMALISPAGIGMGDVKLALAVGAYAGYFGWNVLAVSTLLSFVATAVIGAVLLLFRRVQRGAAVPFGPSMFLGALVATWLA